MNISEAARRSGLSAKTIRYYEEIGLIAAAARGENGYRQYDQAALEELKFMARAREVGTPRLWCWRKASSCNGASSSWRPCSRYCRTWRGVVTVTRGRSALFWKIWRHPRRTLYEWVRAR